MTRERDNGHGHVDDLDESATITDEDRVTLVDPDGNEYDYVLLATIEVEGQDYAVLGPEEQVTDPTREEVELSFFRIITNEHGDEEFASVDDKEEFNAVRDAVAELLGLSDAEEEPGPEIPQA